MKTINIKGKEYVPVVERVKEAHVQDKDVSISTEITDQTDTRISVKATVIFKGKTFTGHSQAVYGKGMMGDVALEVAETSAVGRALGFANIGLIDGIATADEMRKAGVSKAKEVPLAEGFEEDDINFN
jgi:hypothetical protein